MTQAARSVCATVESRQDPISRIAQDLNPAALYRLAGFFALHAARQTDDAKRRSLEKRARAFERAAREMLRKIPVYGGRA